MIHTGEHASTPGGLSVSVVAYWPDPQQLARTLATLAQAIAELRSEAPMPVAVYLVDNGGLPDVSGSVANLERQGATCAVIAGQGNVGYGRGHNLAIDRAAGAFHLVLNPDIDLDPKALTEALAFFGAHPDAGLLAPLIGDDHDGIQYLCRRYPTVFDLFARGFLPARLRGLFARRLARYEMRDLINERDVVWDPPIISGCFMIFRTAVLKRLNGFDERYFLYFEDYDLSLRAHELARVVYVPAVHVQHHGGGAARKGYAHIRMFSASAFKFFGRFGWKWL
ncbi:MAG TPA: glycosyltransferase family 2 protein [Paraburkholderia sp.]|uniref:glycosyltransferase family 2 protein n=1 Tax=Paraburkholderia sp. TaxID=1926495 RepID=UPI002B45EE40|nr:glycosyltransferase family 2 protein [Paraburkholderia sp.]HKR47016.1 glycosyltransferase family 2 protein [Paraburkholderia sp.]